MTKFSLLCLFLISQMLSLTALATLDSKAFGLILLSKGTNEIFKSDGHFTTAKVGTEVLEGDRLKVSSDSLVKIVTHDRNVLVIGANSEIIFVKYKFQEANKKAVEVKLNEGSLRSSLSQKYTSPDESYRVISPTAVIGVRGTDFLTEFNAQKNLNVVTTFKGEVSYKAPGQNGKIGTETLIRAGEYLQHPSGAKIQIQKAPTQLINDKMNRFEVKAIDFKNKSESQPHDQKNSNGKNETHEKKSESQGNEAKDKSNTEGNTNETREKPKSNAPGQRAQAKQNQQKQTDNNANGALPNNASPANTQPGNSSNSNPGALGGNNNGNGPGNQQNPLQGQNATGGAPAPAQNQPPATQQPKPPAK